MFTVTVNIKGEPDTVMFNLSDAQAADPTQLHAIINQYILELYA